MFLPLCDFLRHHKGTGTTEHLIEQAIVHDGYLVVGTVKEALKRKRARHGLQVLSVEELMDQEARWRWEERAPGPIFFDPSALGFLAEVLSRDP